MLRRLISMMNVAVPFDPSDLSPVAWYDFSDPTLLFTDAGSTNVSSDADLIYQANDKSVNTNHLIQTTQTKRFLYKTAARNGLSIGRSDGIDDYMQVSFTLTQPTEVWLVFWDDSWSSGSYYFDGATTPNMILYQTGTTPELSLYAGSASNIDNPDATLSSIHIARSLFSGTSSSITIDNGSAVVGNAGTSSGDGITIAANGGLGNNWFSSMDVCEVIIFNSAQSAANIANMKTWLNNKWGAY